MPSNKSVLKYVLHQIIFEGIALEKINNFIYFKPSTKIVSLGEQSNVNPHSQGTIQNTRMVDSSLIILSATNYKFLFIFLTSIFLSGIHSLWSRNNNLFSLWPHFKSLHPCAGKGIGIWTLQRENYKVKEQGRDEIHGRNVASIRIQTFSVICIWNFIGHDKTIDYV